MNKCNHVNNTTSITHLSGQVNECVGSKSSNLKMGIANVKNSHSTIENTSFTLLSNSILASNEIFNTTGDGACYFRAYLAAHHKDASWLKDRSLNEVYSWVNSKENVFLNAINNAICAIQTRKFTDEVSSRFLVSLTHSNNDDELGKSLLLHMMQREEMLLWRSDSLCRFFQSNFNETLPEDFCSEFINYIYQSITEELEVPINNSKPVHIKRIGTNERGYHYVLIAPSDFFNHDSNNDEFPGCAPSFLFSGSDNALLYQENLENAEEEVQVNIEEHVKKDALKTKNDLAHYQFIEKNGSLYRSWLAITTGLRRFIFSDDTEIAKGLRKENKHFNLCFSTTIGEFLVDDADNTLNIHECNAIQREIIFDYFSKGKYDIIEILKEINRERINHSTDRKNKPTFKFKNSKHNALNASFTTEFELKLIENLRYPIVDVSDIELHSHKSEYLVKEADNTYSFVALNNHFGCTGKEGLFSKCDAVSAAITIGTILLGTVASQSGYNVNPYVNPQNQENFKHDDHNLRMKIRLPEEITDKTSYKDKKNEVKSKSINFSVLSCAGILSSNPIVKYISTATCISSLADVISSQPVNKHNNKSSIYKDLKFSDLISNGVKPITITKFLLLTDPEEIKKAAVYCFLHQEIIDEYSKSEYVLTKNRNRGAMRLMRIKALVTQGEALVALSMNLDEKKTTPEISSISLFTESNYKSRKITFNDIISGVSEVTPKEIDSMLGLKDPICIAKAQKYLALNIHKLELYKESKYVTSDIKHQHRFKLNKLNNWFLTGIKSFIAEKMISLLLAQNEELKIKTTSIPSSTVSTSSSPSTSSSEDSTHEDVETLRTVFAERGMLIPHEFELHVIQHLAKQHDGLKNIDYQKIIHAVKSLDYLDADRHASHHHHHHLHDEHHYRHHRGRASASFNDNNHKMKVPNKDSIFHQSSEAIRTHSENSQYVMENLLGLNRDISNQLDYISDTSKPKEASYHADMADLCGMENMFTKQELIHGMMNDIMDSIHDLIHSSQFTEDMDRKFRYNFLNSVEARFSGGGENKALFEALVGIHAGATEGPGGGYLLLKSVEDINEGKYLSRFSALEIQGFITAGKAWRIVTQMFTGVLAFDALLDLGVTMARGRADTCAYLRIASMLSMAGMMEAESSSGKPKILNPGSGIVMEPALNKKMKERNTKHEFSLNRSKEITNRKLVEHFEKFEILPNKIKSKLQIADNLGLTEKQKYAFIANSLLESNESKKLAAKIPAEEYNAIIRDLKNNHPSLFKGKIVPSHLHAALVEIALIEMGYEHSQYHNVILETLKIADKYKLNSHEFSIILSEQLSLSKESKLIFTDFLNDEHEMELDRLVEKHELLFRELIEEEDRYSVNEEETKTCRAKRAAGSGLSCLSTDIDINKRLERYIHKNQYTWLTSNSFVKLLKIANLAEEIPSSTLKSIHNTIFNSDLPYEAVNKYLSLETKETLDALRPEHLDSGSKVISIIGKNSRTKLSHHGYIHAGKEGQNANAYFIINESLEKVIPHEKLNDDISLFPLDANNLELFNKWMAENNYEAYLTEMKEIISIDRQSIFPDDYSFVKRDYSMYSKYGRMVIKAHGGKSITATPIGLLTGAEFVDYIIKNHPVENLKSIDLQSCNSAAGGVWSSQAQYLANAFNVEVIGYEGPVNNNRLTTGENRIVFKPKSETWKRLTDSKNKKIGTKSKEKSLQAHPSWNI